MFVCHVLDSGHCQCNEPKTMFGLAVDGRKAKKEQQRRQPVVSWDVNQSLAHSFSHPTIQWHSRPVAWTSSA